MWAGKSDYSAVTVSVTGATTLVGARAALVALAGASSPPTSRGDYSSITTAFTGDLSQVGWLLPYEISGTSTLGEPSTGYLFTPELSLHFDYLLNQSGWNQGTATNVGRTAATAHFTKVDNYGQGDCVGYQVFGYVNSAKAGATSWLASPAASAYYADITAGAAGVYLNPVEIDCDDQGHDAAAIILVGNLNRTVSTAALGEPWIGVRMQSTGSAAVDAFLSATGLFTIGLDLTTATLGTQQAAVTLAAGQRIYLAATNSGSFPLGTNPTGPYITSASGLVNIVNGSNQIQVSTAAVTTLSPAIIGGNLTPSADNTYTCGASGFRWSAVWSATGTIQTSDASLKSDIEPISDGLALVNALSPMSYKWKFGGKRTHWGFLASDVKTAFDAAGHTDFAGYVKGEDGTEGLRSDQLVPALWRAVQQLTAEVQQLKAAQAK